MKTRSCGGTATAVIRRERRGNRLVERGRRKPATDERHYTFYLFIFFTFPFLSTPPHGDAHLIHYYYFYYHQYFIFVVYRCAFSITEKKNARVYPRREQNTHFSFYSFFIYTFLANGYLRFSLSFSSILIQFTSEKSNYPA